MGGSHTYTDRFYRDWVDGHGLHRFRVHQRESDLLVLCDRELEREAAEALAAARAEVEDTIARQPDFATSLRPVDAPSGASEIVRRMVEAGGFWNVGPMAAVAGAVAQRVGERLLAEADTAIVENGGDVYARADWPVRFVLYAGEDSPFRDRLAFEVDASRGIGVCTSSGLVGPSLSLGRADAVVAIAPDAAFADAAATSIANDVHGPEDVDAVVAAEEERRALTGLVVTCGDRLGVWGDLELKPAR